MKEGRVRKGDERDREEAGEETGGGRRRDREEGGEETGKSVGTKIETIS